MNTLLLFSKTFEIIIRRLYLKTKKQASKMQKNQKFNRNTWQRFNTFQDTKAFTDINLIEVCIGKKVPIGQVFFISFDFITDSCLCLFLAFPAFYILIKRLREASKLLKTVR